MAKLLIDEGGQGTTLKMVFKIGHVLLKPNLYDLIGYVLLQPNSSLWNDLMKYLTRAGLVSFPLMGKSVVNLIRDSPTNRRQIEEGRNKMSNYLLIGWPDLLILHSEKASNLN